MPIKRGTKVVYTGSNTLGGDLESGNVGWWRDKQVKYYYDKYGLEIGNKGKTCGGYSGGWVRVTWTLSDGSKVSSVPMRSEHFSEADDIPQSEHLIDFEEYSGCEMLVNKPEPNESMIPNLTLKIINYFLSFRRLLRISEIVLKTFQNRRFP